MASSQTRIRPGRPAPLGATIIPRGVNFSVFAKHAEGMELLLFPTPDGPEPPVVLTLDPGLALGGNLPVTPVPTFEAIALQAKKYLRNNENVIIAERVNTDEMYFAKLSLKEVKIEYIVPLQLKKIDNLVELIGKETIITNISIDKKNINDNLVVSLGAPDPLYIAKWCRLFGTDVKTTEYDFLEPNYLKNFITKR